MHSPLHVLTNIVANTALDPYSVDFVMLLLDLLCLLHSTPEDKKALQVKLPTKYALRRALLLSPFAVANSPSLWANLCKAVTPTHTGNDIFCPRISVPVSTLDTSLNTRGRSRYLEEGSVVSHELPQICLHVSINTCKMAAHLQKVALFVSKVSPPSHIPASPPGFSGFIPQKKSLPSAPHIGCILLNTAALACPGGPVHSDWRRAYGIHLYLIIHT